MIVTPAYRANYAEIMWAPPRPTVARERATNAAPYVISDTMEPTLHPVTGEILDSKHKFRQRTRSAGCDEVGTEKFSERTPERVDRPGQDIKRAIEQLRGR